MTVQHEYPLVDLSLSHYRGIGSARSGIPLRWSGRRQWRSRGVTARRELASGGSATPARDPVRHGTAPWNDPDDTAGATAAAGACEGPTWGRDPGRKSECASDLDHPPRADPVRSAPTARRRKSRGAGRVAPATTTVGEDDREDSAGATAATGGR